MQNKKKFTEAQRRQIRHWKNKIKELKLYKKLEVLDFAAQGLTNAQISRFTGYTTRRITELLTEYRKNGIGYFLEEHRKGGNRRNLTDEQETAILEKFREKAEKGQVVSLGEVKREYERVRGAKTANSTFYDFLDRLEWRRVMPRGAHPKKASDEEIESSKKLTKCSEK
jgi:transposase